MQDLFDAGGTAPPLSCRTISPTWGEIVLTAAFANLHRKKIATGEAANLPPCGEMSGRTEGGAKERHISRAGGIFFEFHLTE
ncbi:MAG: hypothetical protein EOS09_19125 [Mesorhizobium sp.]|nr:MAG: hypothetical protein EOS09_19125 [Mesorhizobium sp.]